MAYLDYNSTTPVDSRVVEVMVPIFNERFGNPSSVEERETNPPGLVGKYHHYTKTEHHPYDLAVMTCLIVAKHYLGKGIVVCSDGAEDKWGPARRLCENYVGYGGDFVLGEI